VAFRLLDLENTKFVMDAPENETRYSSTVWVSVLAIQVSILIMMMLMQLNSFAHTRITSVCVVIELSLSMVALAIGADFNQTVDFDRVQSLFTDNLRITFSIFNDRINLL